MLLFVPLWKRKMHRRAIRLSTKCDHTCHKAVYACMSMCMHACVYMLVCVRGGGSKGTCLSETWHQIKGGTQVSPKQLKPKLVLVNSCQPEFQASQCDPEDLKQRGTYSCIYLMWKVLSPDRGKTCNLLHWS